MNVNRLRPLYRVFFAALLLAACSGEGVVDPTPEELEQASPTVVVDGKQLTMEVSLYRDFQPISEPNGRPLAVVARVRTTDGSPLPASLRSERVLVLYEGQVWSTALREELGSDRPRVLEAVARGGPKWGPGVSADVVVRLRDGAGRTHLLRADDRPIHRTD